VRENYQRKAERYVSQGRLTITRLDASGIAATCKGGGRIYACGYGNGRWFCDCEARTTCCHVAALQLVTVREAT
jgi:hypothetical protein